MVALSSSSSEVVKTTYKVSLSLPNLGFRAQATQKALKKTNTLNLKTLKPKP